MRRPDIVALARRYLPGGGEPQLTPLACGLVNSSFKVVRDGQAYVLRTRLPQSAQLGNDQAWESRVLAVAQSRGLTPPIVMCDPAQGVLLTRWVEGETLSSNAVRSPAVMARVAALVRQIQSLPIPDAPRVMSPADWCALYTKLGGAAALPSAVNDRSQGQLREYCMLRSANTGASAHAPIALCHSDLHTYNIIVSGDRLIVLDWEYAHVADRLWDIAGWASNNELDETQRAALLASFTEGHVTGSVSDRFALVFWLYEYVCLLWHECYRNTGGEITPPLAQRAQRLTLRLLQRDR